MSTLRSFNSLLLCLFGLMLLVQGCTPSYTYQLVGDSLSEAHLTPNYKLERTVKWVLPQSSSIWVAFPQNQHPKKINRLVKDSLALSLSERFARVGVSMEPTSNLTLALLEARERGYAYMVYPKLINQENHINSVMEADEDLERYDQIGEDVTVLTFIMMDVANENMIDSSVVYASGGYMHIYRRDPNDLIRYATNQYANFMSP